MLKDVLEGRTEGKRPRGRKRISMIQELLEGSNYANLKTRTKDREKWRAWLP